MSCKEHFVAIAVVVAAAIVAAALSMWALQDI